MIEISYQNQNGVSPTDCERATLEHGEQSLKLVEPSAAWTNAFMDMARDFASAGEHRYGPAARDVAAYVRSIDERRRGEHLPEGWVPGTEFWLEDRSAIIACARLRFELTPALEHEGGHIGYDVRPSMRWQGYGTALLRLVLREAGAHGIQRVRMTCDDDNIGSIKIIERNGGMIAGAGTSRASGKPLRQYWIALAGRLS